MPRLSLVHSLLVGLLLPTAIGGSPSDCSDAAQNYLDKHVREPAVYTGTNMVYFLHVPRTAGRTFHSCLLKLGTPPSRRCTKSYDHLRIDVAVPNCHLLSSHDDFSVVSLLPDGVSVLSQIRDPVDRILSAYEFAVEVAARTMNRPSSFKPKADKMATSDVWPWSGLVPWFTQQIKDRAHILDADPAADAGSWIFVRHPDGSEFYHNKHHKISKWNITEEEQQHLLPELDPYDNAMLPSLKAFVEHPICHELLHNGAAFQVLGITNYSHWDDAAPLRHCMSHHRPTADRLLQVAQQRVARFLHVGTTDTLMESAASAAAALDYSLDGPAFFASDDAHGSKGAAHGTTGRAGSADAGAVSRQMRQTRMSLQSAQKELAAASQKHPDDVATLAPIRKRIAALRAILRDQQDALLAARSARGGASQQEADEPGDDTVDRDQDQAGASRMLLRSARDDPDQGVSHDAGSGCAGGGESAGLGEEVLGGGHRHLLEGQMRDKTAERRMGGTLGQEFVNCAERAQSRNLQRKVNALAHISMPDGRGIAFSRQARARIPAEVIEYIRSANWMDVALHQQASEQLQAARSAQRKAGTLQDLPPSPPQRPAQLPKKKEFPIPKPAHDLPDELRHL